MLNFIAAVYNEQEELTGLINHVIKYVDGLYIADDYSIDSTREQLQEWSKFQTLGNGEVNPIFLPEHTGLPETVKNEALQSVPAGSWVLMLDADERFSPGVLDAIRKWITNIESTQYTHVYFRQLEVIDGMQVREFQKSKLFRKEAVTFSTGIHEDDKFVGEGLYKEDWIVYHRKTSDKQKLREKEYLQTYQKLLLEGKIDMGRYDWLRGLHYFHRGTVDVEPS